MSQYNYDMIETFYDNAAEVVATFEDWGALVSRITPSYGFS